MIIPDSWAGTGLQVITAGILGSFTAQVFKVVWYLLTHGRINFRIFFHTGGMPSSHSASMTALATSVGLLDGFYSTTFAIATGLAIIVMYDAAGVRQAAGKMAGILNKISDDLYAHHPEYLPERLRELLGHTPMEVIIGGVWGVAVAYWMQFCI